VAIIRNTGSITAERVKYSAFFLDLDTANTPENTPVAKAECEYVKAGQRCGPLTITYNASVSFPDHHRVLGNAQIDCLNCKNSYTYWVFMHWQEDGWYSKMPDNQVVDLPKLMPALPNIKSNVESFLHSIAPKTDFAIEE
jgi:hypothetical protein